MKHMFYTATLAVGFALAAALPSFAGEDTTPTLTVIGSGEVSAAPDQAYFTFGVHSTDVDAAQAMAENKSAMSRAFKALTDADVPSEDIRTTGLSLNPRYDRYQKTDGNTPPRIVGYEAHNMVSVTIDEIDALGGVLDALVAAGVNGINQVDYRFSDPSELKAEARAAAALEARSKAEAYARAIGTEITGIVSMDEQGGRAPQPMMRMESVASSAGAVPVSGGTRNVNAHLRVVFSLSGEMK